MTDDNMPDVQPDNSDTLELRTFLNKDVYNSAIEAAALIVQPKPHTEEERSCEDIAAEIRKLKK